LPEDAQEILDHLGAELPEVTDWAGTVGVGISANNAEYFDEPALSVMLCELPSDQYRVFSGVAPLAGSEMSGFEAHTALVHADAETPDLPSLIGDLAVRTDTGYLFGGLSSGRAGSLQFAVSGNGNNAEYTIVAFTAVRIMDVDLTGSPINKRVIIQPCQMAAEVLHIQSQ